MGTYILFMYVLFIEDLLELTSKNYVIFIIGDCNPKAGRWGGPKIVEESLMLLRKILHRNLECP